MADEKIGCVQHDCPACKGFETWPAGWRASVIKTSPGDKHSPWYVQLPGGALMEFNTHAEDDVDRARAEFVAAAINERLDRLKSESAQGKSQ